MTYHTKPAARGSARASECDLAVRLVTSEDSPSLIDLQAFHVRRRFFLPAAIAKTVAALAFDCGGPAA